MKAVVAAFNQEKALVGAFSVIVQPVVEPMARFAALVYCLHYLDTDRLPGSATFVTLSSLGTKLAHQCQFQFVAIFRCKKINQTNNMLYVSDRRIFQNYVSFVISAKATLTTIQYNPMYVYVYAEKSS